jgi:hypothetical protein
MARSNLGNMRANGVRSFAVSWQLYHHEAVINAAPWPDDVPCRLSRGA